MSRLDLVIGPNGAGKSTFVRLTLAPRRPGVPFVNADVIAAERWPDDQQAHAYEAAAIADSIRDTLIAQGRPFIAETVFSHPSKLGLIDRADAAGYDIRLHVIMVPPTWQSHASPTGSKPVATTSPRTRSGNGMTGCGASWRGWRGACRSRRSMPTIAPGRIWSRCSTTVGPPAPPSGPPGPTPISSLA